MSLKDTHICFDEDVFPNLRVVETQVIKATRESLEKFTRKELRYYAKSINVKVGRSKDDTIANLLLSGKATILAQLGN